MVKRAKAEQHENETEQGSDVAAETAEQPGAEFQEREPGDEPAKKPYQPVRGWTSRTAGPLQYRKFTDDKMGQKGVIAFKFNLPPEEKLPPEEALAVMNDHKRFSNGEKTGLRYENTRQHGPIWVLPNDVEGRAIADKIDFKLSQLAQKLEGQDQGPSF